MPSDDPDIDALLGPEPEPTPKKGARPLKRSAKVIEAQAKAALVAEEQAQAKAAQTAAQASAARLAQIVNLHISGMSLEAIGATIGATAAEVDRMLSTDAQRYIRSQPALRTYVRNYISKKYTELLDSTWDRATDKHDAKQLEYQDRSLRVLKEMAKLHGAEAPTQAEVKVEAAPEQVEAVVQRLAAQQGLGYDTSIFDTVPGTVVHQAAGEAAAALEVSGNAVEERQPEDPEDGL